MKDTLMYKDFIGSVHFGAEDRVFHGRVEGINDLVTFEGKGVDELINAFYEAVDDYIELCREADKEPLWSCRGSFNVRINPDMHRKALQKALAEGISLNRLVQRAIAKEVGIKSEERCYVCDTKSQECLSCNET
jgi:predicted HicB family RNase H-like nuclease